MAVLTYLVPAVALLARMAAAQCSAVTTTIQNAGDASALAACSTFSGSIAIATGTTDNIALNGIQEIDGSLIANNVTALASLSADSLEVITDSFTLESITILTNLNFPRLTDVKNIEWQALPNLQQLSFATGVQKVQSLSIDNTQLNRLDGINLQTAEVIMVVNNPYLNTINMQLGNVTTGLTLNNNGGQLKAAFPNLIWANNMTLWNISDLSLPSLASVNGSLGFYSGGYQSLTTPNLTRVGGSLSVVSSDQLTNVSMPQLTGVGGGFQIANNSKLAVIDGFPALKTIGGALDFHGAFKNVSLPSLSDVRGAFNLQSSQDITETCNHFKPLSGTNAPIKGTYTCKGVTDPKGVGSLPAGTNNGGSGGSNGTTSGAGSLLIPGATGFLGFVAVLFGLL